MYYKVLFEVNPECWMSGSWMLHFATEAGNCYSLTISLVHVLRILLTINKLWWRIKKLGDGALHSTLYALPSLVQIIHMYRRNDQLINWLRIPWLIVWSILKLSQSTSREKYSEEESQARDDITNDDHQGAGLGDVHNPRGIAKYNAINFSIFSSLGIWSWRQSNSHFHSS